jgi:hypothetical protein
MNEEQARKILESFADLNSNTGALAFRTGEYVLRHPGDSNVTLDGTFTLEQLKAIAWWLENK